MKHLLKVIFLSAWTGLCVFFMFSCEKKNDPPAPSPNSQSINQFFSENKKQGEFFTVDATTTTTVTGAQGTEITIPANSFVTANGTLVTGNVTIELIEIFDKSDMILSNRPTVSNGQILVSAGEIYINATQNGNDLEIGDNKLITIETPADTIDYSMTLFTGADSSGQFNWTPVVVNDTTNPIQQDTGTSSPWFYCNPTFPYNYIYGINQLGWINCDYFWYDSNPSTTVTVNFTNHISEEIAVYLVFKNINSAMRVYNWSGNFSQGNIPAGSQITVVAVSLKDGKMYLSKQDITVTTNHIVSLTFSEVSQAQLESELNSFN